MNIKLHARPTHYWIFINSRNVLWQNGPNMELSTAV